MMKFDDVLILDGAAGTEMIKHGLPMGVCPEMWAAEHETLLGDMHRGYVNAGARMIYTYSFGANPIKLQEYGLEAEAYGLNKRLAQIAKSCSGNALVAGDISPTGRFIAPMGDISFEQAVECYKVQAKGLLDGGVDAFVIETMMDIQETRAALIAVKEVSDLSVWVSMTFDETGHTLTGTDAKTAAITLCALGADAVGANCGIGPASMIQIVADMVSVSTVPVFSKPNAGLPSGETVSAVDFARYMREVALCGASAVGGCCGSDAEYIRLIKEAVAGIKAQSPKHELGSCITSRTRSVYMGDGLPFCIIGERINPTGKKKLQAALRDNDDDYILSMAFSQEQAGASLLDVNVGMTGIDQCAVLPEKTMLLASRTGCPLCLDSSDADALIAALRVYPGRALINSVSAESGRAETLLPAIKKYGAMYIALPITDDGVPATAAERICAVQAILTKADALSIPRSACVVDALAMSVASQPDAGIQAFDVIRWCRDNGLNSSMGVSNMSFGLPERSGINCALLSCARTLGMTAAIANISDASVAQAVYASDTLLLGGSSASLYAKRFSEQQETRAGVAGAILSGERTETLTRIKAELADGRTPFDIVAMMTSALDELGVLFGSKKIFLPQLMASAEAAKAGFAYLEPLMTESSGTKRAKVVIATVKGDIHDIGKNIVALMLRNHGFSVIDLGRDVPNALILDTAVKEGASIVALSALLTTTMPGMAEFSRLLGDSGLTCKLMVGGAAVTRDFAHDIGALYSRDAAEAVSVAKAAVSAD